MWLLHGRRHSDLSLSFSDKQMKRVDPNAHDSDARYCTVCVNITYIYIYVHASVDPNAYTCIHTKTTASKEATQQSKTV